MAPHCEVHKTRSESFAGCIKQQWRKPNSHLLKQCLPLGLKPSKLDQPILQAPSIWRKLLHQWMLSQSTKGFRFQRSTWHKRCTLQSVSYSMEYYGILKNSIWREINKRDLKPSIDWIYLNYRFLYKKTSSKGCPKSGPYRKTQKAPLRISDFELSGNVVETCWKIMEVWSHRIDRFRALAVNVGACHWQIWKTTCANAF